MQDTALFRHIGPLLLKTSAPETHPQLLEPSLFYDPPYERPLEDEFAWQLVKYLKPISGLRYQVKVETPCANAWIDFVVESGARRIGFELGGLRPAAREDLEDATYRDALVLGSGTLDVLYRFRGLDLLYRPHDALHVVCAWEPGLFTERGRTNLHTLASPEARACRVRPHETTCRIVYEAPMVEGQIEDETFAWPEDVPADLVVHRLSRANPGAWMRNYDAALRYFGVSDDAVGRQWAKSA